MSELLGQKVHQMSEAPMPTAVSQTLITRNMGIASRLGCVSPSQTGGSLGFISFCFQKPLKRKIQ
jgi:hypothetical protein